ncbi:ficolin-1-like [Plakobranchus ocellatus]|uniref:Ficolin-1-like n=1 Tax=Plakobranchus ocellatus TaxID=259542 RepID=A0AAV4DFS8_9GAST|nr:ficolin-1-like [Plakobranchus ocellatus]
MERLLTLFCCSCVILGSHCLRFTLDGTSSTRTREACSILICENLNTTQTEKNRIISLSIFNATQTDPGKPGQDIPVASITLKQVDTSYWVLDGVLVDGVLDSERAWLRLWLMEEKDCKAQYTCEIRIRNSQDQESTSTYRILQQHHQDPNTTADHTERPSESVPMLIFLRKLDIKLAMLDNKVESLSSRRGSVENCPEDNSQNFSNKKENNFEKNFDEKICWNDAMNSTLANIKQHIGKSLDIFVEDLRSEQNQTISTILASIERFYNDQKNKGVAHATVRRSKSHQDMTNVGKYFIELLNKEILVDFRQLKSNVNKLSPAIHQHIPATLRETKATLFNIESIPKDLFNPKACRKGMASILPGKPYPYRVIRPSPGSSFSFPYLCDTTTDGGGWIVIQRRMKGNVNFYRDWASYKKGFGSLDGEFWLGNENIYTTTKKGRYEFRIDLKYKGKSAYAHYDSFWLENERSNYILRLGRYHGTAGDSMGQHKNKAFATKDRDVYGKNCPEKYIGAWWYSHCHSANLNGKWMAYNNKGPRWILFSGKNPVSFSEMKMRKL